MIELLRALLARWRTGHEDEAAAEYYYRQHLANELSAILRDHSGEARKAEVDETVADWCFTADVCAVPHWIIYPGLGNYEGMFARVSDCDMAQAICKAHNAVVAEMRGRFDELQRCFDMALEEWDIEYANRTKLEEAARSNPTPTEASGSRSSEPDAAMWRAAEAKVLYEYDGENPEGREFDEDLFDMCRKDDYAGIYKRMKEKIEQRARELAKGKEAM